MGVIESIVVILLAIVINGILAASEIAFVSLRAHRIEALVEKGYAPAKILEEFSKDTSRFFATIQFGISFVGFLSSMVAAQTFVEPLVKFFSRQFPNVSPGVLSGVINVVMSILLAMVFMIFGELVPKALAYHMSEAVALKTAGLLKVIYFIFSPLIMLVSSIVKWILSLFGVEPVASYVVSEEDIRDMLRVGASQGVIEETEREMIYSIFEFGDKLVRDVMVPRPDIFAIPINASIKEALDMLLESGHSRAPVYGESLDDIRGIVHIKDLVKAAFKGTGKSLPDIVRAPYFVPETWPLIKAFMEMRKDRIVMAIVIDEYGSVSGLLTIEDILEEIVGEIRDEYDVMEEDPIELVKSDDKVEVYHLLGTVSLKDVEDEIGLKLNDEEVDTIGGFIIHALGRFPSEGDEVSLEDGTKLRVISSDNRRVRKVEVVRPKA